MVRWEEIKQWHDPTRIREALKIILELRRREKLRNTKRSIEDVLRLGEAARRLLEFYEEKGRITFILDEKKSIKKIIYRMS